MMEKDFMAEADFSDLPEFGAGHSTNTEAQTGCTVFVYKEDDKGCVCAVDVRGGGPATRETDLLSPEKMVQRANAVVLSGGSAFGLESACGVMDVLAEYGMGFSVGSASVPIVPAACIFDLLVGSPVWPGKGEGAAAARAALEFKDAEIEQGSVGAGCGATVGKLGLPSQAMKSGFGWSGMRLGEIVVISCVVVNALGNIVGEDGRWLAGVRGEDGRILDPFAAIAAAREALEDSDLASYDAPQGHKGASAGEGESEEGCDGSNSGGFSRGGMQHDGGSLCENTTLGVVLTNAKLDQAQATKLAQSTHDSYARAINPVHTSGDGDAIFVMASGKIEIHPDLLAMIANAAMERAIRSAVMHAQLGAHMRPSGE